MIDLYPWFQLLSSFVVVVLFALHVLFAAKRRRRYHDDRSAADLLVAITLLVASLGLLLSAVAPFVGADTVSRMDMRNAGLSMVRGVLVATAVVMVLADSHRRRLR